MVSDNLHDILVIKSYLETALLFYSCYKIIKLKKENKKLIAILRKDYFLKDQLKIVAEDIAKHFPSALASLENINGNNAGQKQV